jgi:outer membrane protein OmpA-like peptidoglycan-associated protein
VVGLGVVFALGGFGSSGFIVVKALLDQKRARQVAGPPQPSDLSPTTEAQEEGRPSAPVSFPAGAPSPDRSDRQEEEGVRQEVLKRIDLMRNLSDKAKDQLYVEVERARSFSKVAVLNFANGRSSLNLSQNGELRQALGHATAQRLLEDPTAVLVVLGYADQGGDDGKNLELSRSRAENVIRSLREQLGSKGVMHPIAMGGQNLIDKENREKNRVVEIWAVLP